MFVYADVPHKSRKFIVALFLSNFSARVVAEMNVRIEIRHQLSFYKMHVAFNAICAYQIECFNVIRITKV